MKTNSLGLPIKESEELVNELNGLLSNYQIYYQNLRGLHWNIRGKRFFDLHIKFEELYNEHKKLVYNLALQYVQNIEDAEEITQDVFIELQTAN